VLMPTVAQSSMSGVRSIPVQSENEGFTVPYIKPVVSKVNRSRREEQFEKKHRRCANPWCCCCRRHKPNDNTIPRINDIEIRRQRNAPTVWAALCHY